MAKNDYVPVTGDDWYQRRRQDAEGEFFRKVADQGPRHGRGGSTRQGIYCLTADGRLLIYKNAGQYPEVMRVTLKRGLAAWKKLPLDRRRPGAVKVSEPGPADDRYLRQLPEGGLVINVYTRILDRLQDGEVCRGKCQAAGGELAARDHLWLTAAEWQALIPTNPKVGDQALVPPRVAQRIVRFHLVDNTRGEPPMWKPHEDRSHELTLKVEELTQQRIVLRLRGSALLSTDEDPAKSSRGFDVCLLGFIGYDRAKKVLDRFDVVAVGDHWGNGPYTRPARPDRAPLGIAFELARGDSAADRVPPQAAREIRAYLQINH